MAASANSELYENGEKKGKKKKKIEKTHALNVVAGRLYSDGAVCGAGGYALGGLETLFAYGF